VPLRFRLIGVEARGTIGALSEEHRNITRARLPFLQPCYLTSPITHGTKGLDLSRPQMISRIPRQLQPAGQISGIKQVMANATPLSPAKLTGSSPTLVMFRFLHHETVVSAPVWHGMIVSGRRTPAVVTGPYLLA